MADPSADTPVTSAKELGYGGDANWTEAIPQYLENNPTSLMFFYSTEVTPVATLDVYEQEMQDLDGSTIAADDLLARNCRNCRPSYGHF